MRILLIVLFLAYSYSILAQEVRQISFEEAVTIGLRNNVDLKREQNNLLATNVNSTASLVDYIPLLPDVSLRGNIGTNRGNSFNQQRGEVVNGRLDFFSGTLIASTTIFSGLNKYYSYRESRTAVDAQIYNVKWTRETVIGDVASQYLACLLDKELLTIAENNLNLQQEQLNKVTEQVQLGAEAEVEQINQEYQVKNAELQLLRAKTRLRNSKAALSQLLQLDPTIQIQLVEPDWAVTVLPDKDLNMEDLITAAIENRADMKRITELEKASSYQMKAIRGLYFPTLSAFFNYGSQYNYIHGIPNREFDQQFFEDNIQNTYGLSVNIPILYGLSTRARVVQAKVDYENAQLTAANILNTVKIDVLNAYQNYLDAISSYEATRSQLEAAQLSFSLEKERFNLGASDLIQYTEANQNHVQAQADHAQAYYTLVFQDILLKYATGTLTLEDIPQ